MLKCKYIILAISMLFIVMSFTANAKTLPSGDEFDYEFYAKTYQDVVKEYGDSEEALYNHYTKEGAKEHRMYADGKVLDDMFVKDLKAGSTRYIDVDKTNQIVRLYEDGKVIWESNCVSGRKGKTDTPSGSFKIIAKKKGKWLNGPTWHCWVNNWMQFTDSACGLHDAKWRKNWAKDAYLTDGSHGCVNLPSEKADELFTLTEKGMEVIVHE